VVVIVMSILASFQGLIGIGRNVDAAGGFG
jgi:hypothetical protein